MDLHRNALTDALGLDAWDDTTIDSDTQFAPIEELRHERPAAEHSATPLAVDMWTLAHFKSLMSRDGWPVQVARMLFDRVYAHERLAFAHGSANEQLRRLALDIFQRMHAQDGQSQPPRH